MTKNQDSLTSLLTKRSVAGFIVALALIPGCTVVPIVSSDTQPDLAAIVKVVSDVYLTEGFDRPVLFLDTGEVCDSVLPSCILPDGGVFPVLKTQLETDLQVKVRSLSEAYLNDPSVPALTPVLPETGEVGVSVTLGRFSVDENGLLRVNVSVARSGLDGAFIEYVLEPADGGWTISETIFAGELSLEEQIRAADQAEVVEGHPDFSLTIALLEQSTGDLAMTYFILEKMETWVSCRWRLAAAINPDFVDEICDRMVVVVGDRLQSHEAEACRDREICLIR